MDQGKLPPRAHLLRLSLLGLNFALSIFTGLALGWAAQKFLHWGDGAVLAGMVLGIVAGYWGLFAELKKLRIPKSPPRDPR
ncbi:MAG TPA: hypothetical protein VFR02_07445 [bacterium]|nr:hypothetical protein [bacterium]